MRYKICLDAGHYGKYNRSPGVPEYYESDMNWKFHLLLKTELQRYGFDVTLTRASQNEDLELTKRGRTAEGCDLFLSLHSNAVGSEMNEQVDHPVGIYFVEDGCAADEKSRELAEILSQTVEQVMQTAQPAKVYSRLSERDRDGDGKCNDDYYGVLYGAHQAGVPGVILEHSFHTCTRSAKWLLDTENLKKLARAEAGALAQYFGLEKLPFVDVRQDSPFFEDIRWAWQEGVIYGRNPTKFDPNTPLTRAEAVAMLHRYHEECRN